jgi:hypothetical protein
LVKTYGGGAFMGILTLPCSLNYWWCIKRDLNEAIEFGECSFEFSCMMRNQVIPSQQ